MDTKENAEVQTNDESRQLRGWGVRRVDSCPLIGEQVFGSIRGRLRTDGRIELSLVTSRQLVRGTGVREKERFDIQSLVLFSH